MTQKQYCTTNFTVFDPHFSKMCLRDPVLILVHINAHETPQWSLPLSLALLLQPRVLSAVSVTLTFKLSRTRHHFHWAVWCKASVLSSTHTDRIPTLCAIILDIQLPWWWFCYCELGHTEVSCTLCLAVTASKMSSIVLSYPVTMAKKMLIPNCEFSHKHVLSTDAAGSLAFC